MGEQNSFPHPEDQRGFCQLIGLKYDHKIGLRDAVLVKTHISPLLTIESPVAQW